jgi:dTDP-4-dehydrorhamnose reductase
MHVLIIGADTPVGLALCQYLEERGSEYVGLLKADCRWKSERQAKKSLRRSNCDFVVDLRLQAAFDGGIRMHDIDLDRSLWLARACQTLKVPLMHLSSARVFTGLEDRAYREDDYPDGSSGVSQILISAESALRDNCEQHVILRIGPVFSAQGINVLTHMLTELQAGNPLILSRRESGCPQAAEDSARVISGMLDQFGCGLQAWGIYHYCSLDMTNSYEFAEVLLAAASQYEEFPADAVQLAVDAVEVESTAHNLDCSKIKDTFAIKQQAWRTAIAGHAKHYFSE